jgi:hypothetical protein
MTVVSSLAHGDTHLESEGRNLPGVVSRVNQLGVYHLYFIASGIAAEADDEGETVAGGVYTVQLQYYAVGTIVFYGYALYLTDK